MQSIISCEELDDSIAKEERVGQEADLIVASVLVGFVCTRYYQGQGCRFDFESPSPEERASFLEDQEYKNADGKMRVGKEEKKFVRKIQQHYSLLDALSWVVDRQEPGMGAWLRDGQSPDGKEGALITGKKGGEMVEPEKRVTQMTFAKARMLVKAFKNRDSLYRGRGAYTGLVEDPVDPNDHQYPTFRVKRPKDSWTGYRNQANWGLIRPAGKEDVNLSDDKSKGMGPLPVDCKDPIGYVHGMCSAIVECVSRGPWATPHEMATGNQTTKMASCFPCSTYMYSSGFPPSSIHLGRGESWVPPGEEDRLEVDGNSQLRTGCHSEVSEMLAQSWQRDIFWQMKIGCACLDKAKNLVAGEYQPILKDLIDRISKVQVGSGETDLLETGNDIQSVARKFLDALTIHDKETNRLRRVLKPAYDASYFEAYGECSPD